MKLSTDSAPSGLAAAVNGARMLEVGDAVVVAGGVENMTRGPWLCLRLRRRLGEIA